MKESDPFAKKKIPGPTLTDPLRAKENHFQIQDNANINNNKYIKPLHSSSDR
jgi:hypothetical protein